MRRYAVYRLHLAQTGLFRVSKPLGPIHEMVAAKNCASVAANPWNARFFLSIFLLKKNGVPKGI